jgi:hypothetical protein
MVWTEAHDVFLCREIIGIDPFTDTKKGTVQRSAKWSDIANALTTIQLSENPFRVDKRAVRDRYNLLADRLRRKLKVEAKASGIETQMTECEQALELIMEKEDASEELQREKKETKKGKVVADRAMAEEIRKKAMENLGTTQKRKAEEGDKASKKKRSSGDATILFLKEKNENQMSLAKTQMELNEKRMEVEAKRHSDMLAMMQQQQQLQMQNFQTILAQQQQQQQQLQQQQADFMMTLFEKVAKK